MMSTCNRLDLQTLGSQLVIMPKNFGDHRQLGFCGRNQANSKCGFSSFNR